MALHTEVCTVVKTDAGLCERFDVKICKVMVGSSGGKMIVHSRE